MHRSIFDVVDSLKSAGGAQCARDYIGEKLEEFEPREVRRILVERYEMRYEIQDSIIYILRLWHTRKDR